RLLRTSFGHAGPARQARHAGPANLGWIDFFHGDKMRAPSTSAACTLQGQPMPDLKPLDQIPVPIPPADEIYRTRLFNHDYSFVGLKSLLGAADFSKAGDRGAGLAASTEVVREAARAILSSLTLQHLYDRPLVDDEGRVDVVMRVGYDIDLDLFRRKI